MRKTYLDLFITIKNNLIVRIKDKQTSFNLSKYSYDVSKPFAKENHLFTDEKLVKDVQDFIKPNISKFWIFSESLTCYIAIAKSCDKDGFNHLLNFGEVVGANIIELAYLARTDETIPDKQEVLDNRVARRNCNIGFEKTQFFTDVNAH